MGQVRHGSAKTTHAIRAAIQRSQVSIKALSERYDLNPKTVAKWKKRYFVDDAPMGPKNVRSAVLSVEEEGQVVQDADRLDAMGIACAFSYGGLKHRRLYT